MARKKRGVKHDAGEVTIALTWPCTSCGKQDNDGMTKICGGCGSPKEDEKGEADRDPVDGYRVLTADADVAKAHGGADWNCSYCNTRNWNDQEICRHCGAGKDGRKPPQPTPAPPPRREYVPEERPPATNWLPVVIGIVAVGFVLFLLVALFSTHETKATVSGLSWRYSATLKRRVPVHGENWSASLPSMAYDRSCQERQDGFKRCNPYDCNPHKVEVHCSPRDTYKCGEQTKTRQVNKHDCDCEVDTSSCRKNNNGTATCRKVCDTCYDEETYTVPTYCERMCTETQYDTCYKQCPNMRSWCTYTVDTWPVVGQEATSGSTHDEHWPVLAQGQYGPNERLETEAVHVVTFKNGDGTWTYDAPSVEDFRRFKDGAGWTISVNRISSSATPVATY